MTAKKNTNSLLSVNDLRVYYTAEGETVEAVNGVSFELERGETLGLVGETGAGKTTIAKAIMSILPDPPAKIKSGEILFHGDARQRQKAASTPREDADHFPGPVFLA